MLLDKDFWNSTYQAKATPWDIGHISMPLQNYIDSLENQELKILIPGAGKAHEAIYLFEKGFKNIFVCDWAEDAIHELKKNHPYFPEDQLLICDFFTIDDQFDLIIEQTFFCAILPTQRSEYVKKAASLLNEGGKLTGLLFASHFPNPGPPFGGTKSEYAELFEPLFEILELEMSQNSILPRLGNELFFRMKKK